MVEFKLPDVGEGMHEGEIVKVLVRVGESVRQDQPLLEVQTDKVNAELSAPVTGVVREIFIAEGDTVEVGTTLLVMTREQTQRRRKRRSRGPWRSRRDMERLCPWPLPVQSDGVRWRRRMCVNWHASGRLTSNRSKARALPDA